MPESRELAALSVAALADKKGEDIRVIDIRKVSVMADYFVLATGLSAAQVQAMTDGVQEKLGGAGAALRQVEGGAGSGWILMDYGDVIVHIFRQEDRLFYDLERIWRDGVFMEPSAFQVPEAAGQSAGSEKETKAEQRRE